MIIAEIGLWHGGDVDKALKIVRSAHACGADAVKFQIFVKDEPLFCPLPGDGTRQFTWDASAMSEEAWLVVRKEAAELGMRFGASAFQSWGCDLLRYLEPDFIKVASRAVMSFPYERFKGPFFISTGMIARAGRLEIVKKLTDKKYQFLHCVSKYPTPLEEARWPGNGDGLSDHSGTMWIAIEALARGCEVIEVHFTNKWSPRKLDAAVSLGPEQLKMICGARDAFAQMR